VVQRCRACEVQYVRNTRRAIGYLPVFRISRAWLREYMNMAVAGPSLVWKPVFFVVLCRITTISTTVFSFRFDYDVGRRRPEPVIMKPAELGLGDNHAVEIREVRALDTVDSDLLCTKSNLDSCAGSSINFSDWLAEVMV